MCVLFDDIKWIGRVVERMADIMFGIYFKRSFLVQYNYRVQLSQNQTY